MSVFLSVCVCVCLYHRQRIRTYQYFLCPVHPQETLREKKLQNYENLAKISDFSWSSCKWRRVFGIFKAYIRDNKFQES